ncbi:hypothetical protein, partial [Stutzerimonas stutzeri]|uniref:hypothetical protein n=1 Tax=Stutzerimonas stutzeri TaxID=316 RepID=UPI00210C3E4C
TVLPDIDDPEFADAFKQFADARSAKPATARQLLLVTAGLVPQPWLSTATGLVGRVWKLQCL